MRIWRIVVISLAILVGAVVFAGAAASSASAQTGVYMLRNQQTGECLNGYIGTAHAEVTLQPCNTLDDHFWWTVTENGIWTVQNDNGGNFYCLNGYIGTAHAEVTLTPPNSNDSCPGDLHVDWSPFYIGTEPGTGLPVYSLENEANGYCLNGTLSKVYLTAPPCNGDRHVEWALVPAA